MRPDWLVLAATCIALSSTSLNCSRASKDAESRGNGGASSSASTAPSATIPSSSGASTHDPDPKVGSAAGCARVGWSSVPLLGADCRGVCQPDSLERVPKLEFKPRPELCEGCSTLQTPWATTTPEAAVAGGVRAYGPGPDWLNIGILLDGGKAAIVGIYDAELAPVTGFFVDTAQDEPCGRLSSVKFSPEGELGAHVLTRIGEAQRLYATASRDAASLLQGAPRFTWPPSVVARFGINDMWFSKKRVVMDLSGSIWIGDTAGAATIEVARLAGAPSGEYSRARVLGDDVFVSHWAEGRSRWFAYVAGKLRPLLGDATKDIRDFVTDGKVMVWLEGTGATQTPDGALQFSRYDLMTSPYTVDAALIEPKKLAENVPPISNLTLANGRVAGIYVPDPKVVRAAALVVRVDDGQALRSELPNGYSWGYELYPTPTELWGAITPGPMISFETVARVPYSRMQAVK
jgi:hypothetical protein